MFSRRKRRVNSSLPPEDSSASRSSATSSRTILSLLKPLSGTSSSSNPVEHGVDDPKGPLGLSLLYSPSKPHIDFIFVHGLGGGSRKTWSKTPLPSHYWPREWLSKDSAFESVRINSYGYSSDYLKDRANCLNIHHFGKSLLGAISTSPCLSDSKTNIVAIGHSMGGLVIKKAYLLARQDPAYKNLAERFTAIYFLATPHRGSDSAKMLKNLLRVAYDRIYVAELERNSVATQVINDEFRHVSTGLELWSFYETQNMKPFGSPIVDPESAVLGYHNEKQIPVDADHRSICKFDTPLDINYTLLRNALASTVRNIASVTLELELKEKRDKIKDLRAYLGAPLPLDDDLLSACESRMPETCQWISTKTGYTMWRDGDTVDGRIFWIKGKPAAGKSVLAGYIIDHLQKSGQACSYFFFKHADGAKSDLSRCLRSLALQMASLNTKAGDAVLELQADGIRLDHLDERSLWRILFLAGIFPVTTTRNYWVIDALDECSDPRDFLDTMLPNIDESVPLRILVISRDTTNLNEGFAIFPSPLLQTLEISIADTRSDLRQLIESKTKDLRVVGPVDRASLADSILDKSRGSFLWPILVVKELLRGHGKEIDRILEEVPKGMESLYKRTLTSMSKAGRGKQLARAILIWVVCAIRPMTIGQLNGALGLDMDDVFPDLEQSIAALCGELVVVDKFGRVQMIHETAREFLLSDGLDSEFAIEEREAHTRLAQACLIYLKGKEIKPPRTNRRRVTENPLTARSDFASYAYTAFSYHLSKADPLAVRLLELVGQFFKANVLTWIEAVAHTRDLNQLIRAAKHLKTYLDARTTESSPLDPKVGKLRQWVADLSRIPTKFSNVLATSPSAIYFLIPPFCPTDSEIYWTGGLGRRLKVLGALGGQWDDRLLSIDFRQGQPSALCYGEELLAIGLTSGTVALYSATSSREYKVMDHGESVRLISFQYKTHLMASCGMKMLKIWDTRSGTMAYAFESPPRPLAMEFAGDTLLVASQKNYIASWVLGLDEARELSHRPWSDKSEADPTPPRQLPCALALSHSQGMLAAAYNGQPITLWDLEEDAFVGSCGKKLSSGKTSTHPVVALIFNPDPDVSLLVAAYLDGDLALLDPFTDRQLKCIRANCQSLAASPNGHFLAAGGAEGTIYVYEFGTLKLLYRVKSANSYIKQLSFTRDNLRLADIRGTQCTVWSPGTLLQYSPSDDGGGTDHTSTSIVETVVLGAKTRVTTMVSYTKAEVIFCGKDDGGVVLYNRETAVPVKTLYSHKAPVRNLVWCEKRSAILSVDASSKILLYEVRKLADATMLFQSRLKSELAVIDVLVEEEIGKFVVSTREADYLFSLENGEKVMEWAPNMLGMRKWLRVPQSSHHLLCVSGTEARIYSWTDGSEIGSFSLSLDNEAVQLNNVFLYSFNQQRIIALELSVRTGWTDKTSIAIIDARFLAVSGTSTNDHKSQDIVETPLPDIPYPYQPASLNSNIAKVIGISNVGRLVFIDRSSWVCSVDLREGVFRAGRRDNSATIEILRHFFIPYEWFSGERIIVCAMVENDILLTRAGDLVVIRGAFEYAEKVEIS